MLKRNPVFTIAAIASLALGIGVNTAVFTMVNTLVFRPLPVHDPSHLVRIGSLEDNGTVMPLPGPVLDELRKDSLLKGICGFTAGDAAVGFGNKSLVVPTLSVTGDCYQTLGVRPVLGRLFTRSDDQSNVPKVAVLGYQFWKTKLGGNENVLGRTVKISGTSFRVIGVTEPRFEGLIWGYPMNVSAPISQRTDKSTQDPSGHFYWAETLGRLQGGVRARTLEAQLKTKWRRLLDVGLPPGFKGRNRTEIVSMPPVVTSGATGIDYYFREHFEKALFSLLAISILILLVSCVNVANLLLARGVQRQREIGIRLAIGAARWRILRQLLAENGLLLFGGLTSAFVLAYVSGKLTAHFLISAYARSDMSFTLEVDWRVLLFSASTAVLAVLTFAIFPAYWTSGIDPNTSLKNASRSMTGSCVGSRRMLLVGQVAITFVILVCASVFARSTAHLRDSALDFNATSVLDVQLMPAPEEGPERRNTASYFFDLLDGIRVLPGVQRVSLTSFAPLVSAPYKEDIRRMDHPDQVVLQAPAEFVTDDFLDIMHIPLLQGRDFRRTEAESSQRTVIVSQSVAKRLFPDGQAVGRHIQFGTEPETRNLEIIGIAADRPLEDPHLRYRGFVLLNLWQLQRMADWGNLQVQFSGTRESVATSLRKEVDKFGLQQVFLLSTMSELRERSLLQDRLLTATGRIYGLLVLVLAALGLLGLLLFLVSSREKEIAIRIALGAGRRSIKFLVIKEAARLTGIGLLTGAPASYAMVHSFSSIVHGVPPQLIGPALTAAAALCAIAVFAILIPAYRTSLIKPNAVLRDS